MLLIWFFIFSTNLPAQERLFNLGSEGASDNATQEAENPKDYVNAPNYPVAPVPGEWMSAYPPNALSNETNYQAGHAYYDPNLSKYVSDYLTNASPVNSGNKATITDNYLANSSQSVYQSIINSNVSSNTPNNVINKAVDQSTPVVYQPVADSKVNTYTPDYSSAKPTVGMDAESNKYKSSSDPAALPDQQK